jgi:glycosyl hydrolase family 99
MGRAAVAVTCVVVLWAGLSVSAGAAPQASLTLPARGAFYYPWYPATWTVNGAHVFYHPSLDYYSSSDPSVVDQHISALDYAHVKLGIASWFGPNTQSETVRIPLLLNRTVARSSPLKWALFYEREGTSNPTVAQIQSDLAYVNSNYASHSAYAYVNGKPVIFVWNENDTTCEVATRWNAAAGGWYVVLKVFGSGYRNCAPQPDSWHAYAPANAESTASGFSFAVSPGFWRADDPSPRLARDLGRWQQNVNHMVASQAPWQLITTFNEWGEGTAVEHATEWGLAPHGQYIEALHNTGGPTAVEFQAASASRIGAGVRVRWRTASESRLLGFNLYREQNGKRVRLNRGLIPSAFAGGAVGRSYSWLDRRAPRNGELRYWLEAVSVSGARSWRGPIVARAR